MSNAFFVPDGDRAFMATELTRGPWGPDSQHASPPAALLGRAAERFGGRDDLQVVRATFDILRPVPVARLEVETELVRPGKNLELVRALLTSQGEAVMTGTFWRIRTNDVDLPEHPAQTPPSQPSDWRDSGFFNPGYEGPNYISSMEWRLRDAPFSTPGRAAAWVRMSYPLVAGEGPSPLQRVLMVADSGSGISAALDFATWLFVNPDLTVYLRRLPVGEWVCMEAETRIEPNGIGMATSTLYDEKAALGRGAQSLYVAPRRQS